MGLLHRNKEKKPLFNKELLKTDLTVTVRNGESVLYEGPAKSITATNDYGNLDILPGHIHFISTIKEKVVVTVNENDKRELPLEKAILRVFDNKVDIFLGIETLSIFDQLKDINP